MLLELDLEILAGTRVLAFTIVQIFLRLLCFGFSNEALLSLVLNLALTLYLSIIKENFSFLMVKTVVFVVCLARDTLDW